MRLCYLVVISIFTIGCSGGTKIEDEKTILHKYVINTDCYLIPPSNYKETREYSGFQDRSFWWSIQINKEMDDMEHFEKLYSPQNLRKTKRNFIEKEKVNYGNKFNGFLVKHKSKDRAVHSYGLVIDCIDYRIHINSWVRNQKITQNENRIIQSMLSLYIANPEDINESMNNPFTVETDKLEFDGVDSNNDYIYKKIRNENDSFKLTISHITDKFNFTNSSRYYFEDLLGVDYIETNAITIDSTWLTKYTLKEAMNKSKTKKVIVGCNSPGFSVRYYFAAEYSSNFMSNDSLIYNVAPKIKFYK